MPLGEFPKIQAPPANFEPRAFVKYVADLANLLGRLSDELDYIVNGELDVQNIKAKSITADRLKVDELSAITANLGTVTAGTIIGLLIETAASGNYPRIEFNPSSHYILVEESASNSYKVDPSFIGVTSPASLYQVGSFIASIAAFSAFGAKSLQIASPEDIDMIVGSGHTVNFGDWDEIYSDGDGQTLGAALNAKLDASAGWSGTYSDGTNTITVVNGQITSVV